MTQPISLGKVQVIHGTPPCQPGKCVMCGTTEGPFFDFGFEIDFYGVVYFCASNCFREMANTLEYYSPSQVTQIKDAYDVLVDINKDFVKENGELRNALDALTVTSRYSLYPSVDPDSVVDKESEGSETVAGVFDRQTYRSIVSESNGDDSATSEGETGSSEQANESGSSNVQHDDSLEEFLRDIDI